MERQVSLATVKRVLAELRDDFYVQVESKGRATRYSVSPLLMSIDMDEYYSKEVDERHVLTGC